MLKKFFSSRYIIISLIVFLFIYVYSFFNLYFANYTIINDNPTPNPNINYQTSISSKCFAWPVPGCKTITSYFGYRQGSAVVSSYHSGLDIGAPTGTYFVAITDGTIVNTGWTGSGGFTITLVNQNLRISYCHSSPDFIVKIGQKVSRGEVIGQVGPKNVYTIPNNPYKDSKGNPTNGAMTGPHLHLTIRKDGVAVNPLDYL